jgi:tetratricopeptide (TPR) repeat protein
MITASPITRQTVGRTFIVAISVLGFIAVTQLGGLIWAFVLRSQLPPVAVETPADGGNGTLTATVRPNFPPPFVAPLEADFSANPFTPDEPAPSTLGAPKPVPMPARTPTLPEPEQAARFKEAITQGKLLRDRGDMGTALTRFREAAAMDARSPEAIFEIAVTYEKMQLLDRAAEQWRRIYEMGESAGPYYTAAESRLNQVKSEAMRQAINELPSTNEAVEGIPAGKTLGLLAVAEEDHTDRSAEKRLTLRIPIKARPREKIDVRDLTIQVLFYDVVDKQNLVQTTANVSSRWTTAPADWADSDTETLEVNYELPLPDPRASKRESRKYFGYLVRVYYKAELQASTGAPEKLVQQFPPEPQLQPDANENR